MTVQGRPGLRSEAVRVANLSTILRQLHLRGATSRSDVVRDTGLTRTAISALVTELNGMQFVAEAEPKRDGNRGRPSAVVKPSERINAVIALDLMVDSIGVAAVGLGGAVLRAVRRDQAKRRPDVSTTVTEAAGLVESIRRSLDDDCRLFGIGVGVPGLVRRSDQSVAIAPNLGWRGVELVERLAEALDTDLPIVIQNEANLGALAESRRGVAAGRANLLYVSAEVGVGGGIVQDGRIMAGRSGFAGEVGHISVSPTGRTCRCGAIGCLETEIGEEALLERSGRPRDGGHAAVTELLAAADADDPAARDALDEHARWLAIGLASLANVLDPDVIVLGGLLADVHPYIAETLNDEVAKRSMPMLEHHRLIAASTLGDEAPLIGAAELAWDQALDDPQAALRRAEPVHR